MKVAGGLNVVFKHLVADAVRLTADLHKAGPVVLALETVLNGMILLVLGLDFLATGVAGHSLTSLLGSLLIQEDGTITMRKIILKHYF